MRHLHSVALAGAIAAAATAGPAVAGPDYHLVATIAVPSDPANVQTGGAFTAFDISFFDPATGNDYVADRSNAAVDIFSGSSLAFLGRATGFTGQLATTSISGADGVVTVTSGGTTTLYAGDGNSTLRVFNATNPANPMLLQAISTGGALCSATIACRVDEMAYSPTQHLLLAANNADSPAFGNLFSTNGPASTPATLLNPPGHITVPALQGGIDGGGMEQSAWDPKTGTFFVSIPALSGTNNPGGVAEIDTAGNVLRTIDLGTLGVTSCSPSGLAVGGSGNLMVGCANAGAAAILLNPTGAGSIVKQFAGLGGTDELWYDPGMNAFYVTGNDGSSASRFFDVVTDDPAGGNIIQRVDLPETPSAHSIAVDLATGDVFVPLAGTTSAAPNDLCPLGCIAVFATPEPSSIAVMGVALIGIAGSLTWRNRHRAM